ncbi:MAG: rhodanese-like domain-containing protein [Kofleriaceae bacterium]
MLIGLTPIEIEGDRTLVIVDMRPAWERVGDLGFIPGSILLPYDDDPLPFAEQLAHLGSDGPVVLACVSGRRSGLAVAALAPLLGPTRHLEGGLLAWGAAGFPLCHSEEQPTPAPGRFHAAFRSTLLAELIQVSVDTGYELDPLALLDYLYQASGVAPAPAPAVHGPDGTWRLLDRAAGLLRTLGADSDRIVEFLEPLYGAAVEPARRAAAR